MLKICSSVMATGLSKEQLDALMLRTKQYEIKLETRDAWVQLSKTEADRFVCTPEMFPYVNPMLYPKTVMLVDELEDVTQFLTAGVSRFITDINNDIQFLQAMYVEYEAKKDRKRFTVDYTEGEYEFYFTHNEFFYKGEGIYLLPSEKRYLYDWLVFKEKDNTKRIYLYNIRKRLGDKSFLKNINKYGVER